MAIPDRLAFEKHLTAARVRAENAGYLLELAEAGKPPFDVMSEDVREQCISRLKTERNYAWTTLKELNAEIAGDEQERRWKADRAQLEQENAAKLRNLIQTLPAHKDHVPSLLGYLSQAVTFFATEGTQRGIIPK